jgi:hypothetical protein
VVTAIFAASNLDDRQLLRYPSRQKGCRLPLSHLPPSRSHCAPPSCSAPSPAGRRGNFPSSDSLHLLFLLTFFDFLSSLALLQPRQFPSAVSTASALFITVQLSIKAGLIYRSRDTFLIIASGAVHHLDLPIPQSAVVESHSKLSQQHGSSRCEYASHSMYYG